MYPKDRIMIPAAFDWFPRVKVPEHWGSLEDGDVIKLSVAPCGAASWYLNDRLMPRPPPDDPELFAHKLHWAVDKTS